MSDICEFVDQMASPALSLLFSSPVDNKHEMNDELRGAPSDATLIRCDLGISHSLTIIAAYLFREFGMQ